MLFCCLLFHLLSVSSLDFSTCSHFERRVNSANSISKCFVVAIVVVLSRIKMMFEIAGYLRLCLGVGLWVDIDKTSPSPSFSTHSANTVEIFDSEKNGSLGEGHRTALVTHLYRQFSIKKVFPSCISFLFRARFRDGEGVECNGYIMIKCGFLSTSFEGAWS